MKSIAERYVRLVLVLGLHDKHYVDAYYGPEEWRPTATISLAQIREEACSAVKELETVQPAGELEALRKQFLATQLEALAFRARMLEGEKVSFDEECRSLYGVEAPIHPDAYYDAVISELEGLLPGTGDLSERYERFCAPFRIPAERLARVFDAAIQEARNRTRQHIALPDDENFRIEYVRGEVWGAYNWYQGASQSLIQVNTDFPMSIGQPLHLACHEGYPGHHVYNLLLEQKLMSGQGWMEFSVYPLFSPESLIAEGTAEYAVEMLFTAEERLEFEKSVIYPLASLDASQADEFGQVREVVEKLRYTSVDGARRYLDGEASKEETISWLVKYGPSTPERAEQRLRFFEANRSYVATYEVGQDLVRDCVEKSGPDRWKTFERILSTPQVPSNLTK